jgi:predicted lipid carrier protein YhbT
MPAFLTDEWFDVVGRDVPPLPDDVPPCRVEVTVLRGPDGDVKFTLTIADAQVGAAAGGTSDAEVAVTLPYDDVVAVMRGELDPNVAFMQGRMKTAGDPGLLLDVLAATARAGYRTAREQLSAATTL